MKQPAMHYYSLEHNAPEVTFREAALRGIAPDRGLYFPKHFPAFPKTFWESVSRRDFFDVAFELMSPYTGDSLPEDTLRDIPVSYTHLTLPTIYSV